MPLPRMSDLDRKNQARLIQKATAPLGGSIPEIERNVTTVGTGQITATQTPQQLSYVSRDKIATKLTNLSATDIFWGTTQGVSPTSGDLLPGGRGNWVAIPGACVIWVVCAAGQTALMSWAEAYDD